MSYILDALNKADKARKHGSEHLASLPAQNTQPQQAQKKLLPWLLLACGIGVLFFWLSPWQTQKAPEPSSLNIPIPDSGTKKLELSPPVNTQTVPGLEPSAIAEPEMMPRQNQGSESSNVSVEEKTETIPSIAELPQYIQDALPNIRISAHTYAESPNKRMVIINDKMLRENKFITERLLLKHITETGVELEFDGLLFSMFAFDSWPY